MTVRDSMGSVVQFVYGADSLDPTDMEAKDQPIDFHRIMAHIKVRVSAVFTVGSVDCVWVTRIHVC